MKHIENITLFLIATALHLAAVVLVFNLYLLPLLPEGTPRIDFMGALGISLFVGCFSKVDTDNIPKDEKIALQVKKSIMSAVQSLIILAIGWIAWTVLQ